jgi:hypothetical protein
MLPTRNYKEPNKTDNGSMRFSKLQILKCSKWHCKCRLTGNSGKWDVFAFFRSECVNHKYNLPSLADARQLGKGHKGEPTGEKRITNQPII